MLYTVSETASSLYLRYLNAEKQLMDEANKTLDKCIAITKEKKRNSQ